MNLGRGAACLAAVCVFVPSSVQAALWAAAPSLELSSVANDNYGLAFDRRNRVGLVSMTGGLLASRETETMATRLNANLVGLFLRGDLHQDEWQDSLSLSHTLKGPVDTFSFDAKAARDETLQTPVSSADLLIGRGLQRSATGEGSWEHHLTERLGMSGSLAIVRTRYSAAQLGAHDYQDGSGSASLRYLLDERSSVNASLAHQDYRTLDNGVRSMTDSLSMGGSRALSETSTATVSIGAYRARTGVVQPVLACPGNSASCGTPIVVTQVGRAAHWGAQYNASYDGRLSELTHVNASAARQQDPSGAGVTVLSDTLRAGVDHAASETLSSNLSYTFSRSRYEGLSLGQTSRLQTLTATATKQLTPQLSLRATADHKRSSQSFDGLRAHSTSIAFTLRYEWQRLDSQR